VSIGIKADPRGKRGVEKLLAKEKESYDKLSEEEKKEFDLERLDSPFADTRILNGDAAAEVNSLIAGIDMEAQELLLADRLREKGRSIDLVLAHHPEGKALASLADVMGVQADIWHIMGVPINVGAGIQAVRGGPPHAAAQSSAAGADSRAARSSLHVCSYSMRQSRVCVPPEEIRPRRRLHDGRRRPR
jgi:hypothetical protein